MGFKNEKKSMPEHHNNIQLIVNHLLVIGTTIMYYINILFNVYINDI